MKSITIASAGTAILLALCSCGKIPSESLRLVGGGTEMIFVLADGAGAKREILIENPAALNIPAGLGGQLVEKAGVLNETVFKVVAGVGEPCTIPGEDLAPGTSCKIGIEYNGTRGETGTYVLEFGTRLQPRRARATFPIRSQTATE